MIKPSSSRTNIQAPENFLSIGVTGQYVATPLMDLWMNFDLGLRGGEQSESRAVHSVFFSVLSACFSSLFHFFPPLFPFFALFFITEQGPTPCPLYETLITVHRHANQSGWVQSSIVHSIYNLATLDKGPNIRNMNNC